MQDRTFVHGLKALPLVPGIAVLSAATLAQGTDIPTGVWSRVVSGAYMREVIEITHDGTYTSGVCGTVAGGWCIRGEATASREGRYSTHAGRLTLDRGLVRIQAPAPVREETYPYKIVRDPPDDPPRAQSRPPLRRLYITSAGGEEIMFNEMPTEYRPRWVPRSAR